MADGSGADGSGQAQADRVRPPRRIFKIFQPSDLRGLVQPRWIAPVALGWSVLLGLGLTGCDPFTGSSQTPEAASMANQRVDRSVRGTTVVSKMLPARLRLRRGWRAAPPNTLHSNADLQAYNPNQNIFLVVLGESNANVLQGGIEDQAIRYLQLMQSGFDRVISSEARTSVERINGFPAVQYEVRGEVLGKAVAYLHTTVQMDNHYYQIVVWTPDTLHAANAEEMRAIVQEFGPDRS
jgi:hypothetical protein